MGTSLSTEAPGPLKNVDRLRRSGIDDAAFEAAIIVEAGSINKQALLDLSEQLGRDRSVADSVQRRCPSC